MRWIWLVLLFSLTVPGGEIRPSAVFTVRGFVNDFAMSDGRLYVATDRGSVDVFDLEELKLLYQIVLEPTRTGRGETVPVRVLSVDVYRGKILVTGIADEGFRAVWLFDGLTKQRVIAPSRKLMIKEARFSKEGDIVLATFSSELIRFSPEERAPLYRRKPSDTALGDMAMGRERASVVMSDESGAVRVVDTRTGSVLQVLPSGHLDHVFHVAVGEGVVVTGGNDRRVSVFTSGRHYDFRTGFPVYCVGVSPGGKTGVYLKGDAQYLQLFDILTGEEGATLVGHEAVVNQIRFLDERTLVSSEKGPKVFVWKLPPKGEETK